MTFTQNVICVVHVKGVPFTRIQTSIFFSCFQPTKMTHRFSRCFAVHVTEVSNEHFALVIELVHFGPSKMLHTFPRCKRTNPSVIDAQINLCATMIWTEWQATKKRGVMHKSIQSTWQLRLTSCTLGIYLPFTGCGSMPYVSNPRAIDKNSSIAIWTSWPGSRFLCNSITFLSSWSVWRSASFNDDT